VKLLKLLMVYLECRRVGNIIETLIYVAAMMVIIIFACVLCGIMEWISWD